jgi:two-component system cell cycle response regulator
LDNKDSTIVTIISKADLQPAEREACLVVINGLDLGKRYALDHASITIGRSSKNDIQIDEDSISRNHAMLVNNGTGYVARDLGSTNGTYVNDIQIKEQNLADGNQIRVGRTIFKFLMGTSIENAYHEEIYRLTTQDSLTQVFNKRYLLENLEREMSRALRYGRKMAMIIFDIDHFKRVNDEYGHLTGDFVLKQVATRIKDHIRRDDIFARYGGEEFVILLPELSKPDAAILAEKIRALVAAEDFTFDQTKIPITISLGITDLDEYMALAPIELKTEDQIEANTQALIKIADDRLLEAKRRGRNCVITD